MTAQPNVRDRRLRSGARAFIAAIAAATVAGCALGTPPFEPDESDGAALPPTEMPDDPPVDECPTDPAKTEAGLCGCGATEADSDGDGFADCIDDCVDDADKEFPGVCGCGVSEVDADIDGTPDCVDGCPLDQNKTGAGACGCGLSDDDSDIDGVPNCLDECPEDADKVTPGICGCGVPDGTCESPELRSAPGGPYPLPPEALLFLEGSGSFSTAEDALISYEWDLDNDGAADVSGIAPAAIPSVELRETWGMVTGDNPIQLRITDALGRTATATDIVTLNEGPSLIGIAAAPSSRDTWNNVANWSSGASPTGASGAVLEAGVAAVVDSNETPNFAGGLLLKEDAVLTIGFSTDNPNNVNALGTGPISMRAGSQIVARAGLGNYDFFQGIVLEGDATIWGGISTANHRTVKTFSGGIRGPGRLTYNGVNGTVFRFDQANPLWRGGLQTRDPQIQTHSVEALADHCFGSGDVAINDNCSLVIGPGLSDAIDDDAILSLNGPGSSNHGAKLVLQSNESVAVLVVDGVQMAAGTYTSAETWLDGPGLLTVLTGP